MGDDTSSFFEVFRMSSLEDPLPHLDSLGSPSIEEGIGAGLFTTGIDGPSSIGNHLLVLSNELDGVGV